MDSDSEDVLESAPGRPPIRTVEASRRNVAPTNPSRSMSLPQPPSPLLSAARSIILVGGIRARTMLLVGSVLILGCILGCGGSGAPDTAIPEQPSVLLVTFDTTRADRIGCYGYQRARTPIVDGLAAGGVRFDDATAQTPTTLPSHASIFNGTYSPYHGGRGNGFYRVGDENESLVELLQAAGYQTAGVAAAFVLDRRFGLAQGFDIYDDDSSDMAKSREFTDASRSAESVNRAALAAIDRFDPRRPFFLWVHYFDPHAPHAPPAEFQQHFPRDTSGRYDAEIARTDARLGELIDELTSRGLMKNTLTVFTADHGEGFPGPHDELTHGIFVYHDTLRIPLIFHAPQLIEAGSTASVLARQIDIAPTILDLLGMETGEMMQGRSLAPWLRGNSAAGADEEPVLSYAESVLGWDAQGWSPLFTIRDQEWKLIMAPRPELYDLKSDPDELDNIYSPDHEQVARLLPELVSIRDTANPMRPDDVPGQPISARDARRLQQLGYILAEGTVEVIPDDLAALKDPKDFIELQVQLELARNALADGDVDRGIALLELVLARDPENLEANQQLAGHYKAGGDYERALRYTETILAARENWTAIHSIRGEIFMARASSLWAAGKKDAARDDFRRAVEAFARAAELNSGEPAHPARMATIHADFLGEAEKAIELFKKALAIDPEEARTQWGYGKTLFKLQRFAEARDLLERASRDESLAPTARIDILWMLAQCHAYTGAFPNSLDTLDRLIQGFPDHPGRAQWQTTRDGMVARLNAQKQQDGRPRSGSEKPR